MNIKKISKNLLCPDVRKYSWQVAPLQSLFPLLSGRAKVKE
jgi:hypothetical protein